MDIILTFLTLGVFRFVFVKEGTSQIVTRFGRYVKILDPGLQFFWFFWGFWGMIYKFRVTDTMTGDVMSTTEIDMKETVYDYPREKVISKDNVQFEVNAVVYFRVSDPYKALFKVSDYVSSLKTLVQSILRAEMGKHDLEESYSNRTMISTSLTREAKRATESWGIEVLRLEIKEFELGDFVEDLLRQKRQDIQKREHVLHAEGLRDAKIKDAEGTKLADILVAEGRRQAAQAEGEAIQTLARAAAESEKMKYQAEAYGYKIIADILRENPEVLSYLHHHSANQVSKNLADGQATKLFLPNNIDQLVSAFSVIPDIALHAGTHTGAHTAPPHTTPPAGDGH